ncbi:MAG: hypothetical protein H6636_03540 [Anaerolineales bacterium]|nr:hypothetical protein [Anaerolineales bacterium]
MKRLVIFLSILSALGFGVLLAQPARAAAISVTTPADVVSGLDGLCSLREAVIAANTNTGSGIVVGECPAGSDTETDVITLADGETYTLAIAGKDEYASATGDLNILDNAAALDMQIVVADNGLATIDADSLDRALYIENATVEISGVTFTNGDVIGSSVPSGGNILNNDGLLTINGGVIRSGKAEVGGGLYNYNSGGAGGHVTLNDTDVFLNSANAYAGGIFSGGTTGSLTLIGANVRANTTAGLGAGLALLGGSTDILSSTVTLNASDDKGGGLIAETITLNIQNSLFEGNQALSASGGGIYLVSGLLTMTDTTLADNMAGNGDGGALYVEDGAQLEDGLLAGNTFTLNTASGSGGAIYVHAGGDLVIADSDFSQNTSGGDGGAIAAIWVAIQGSTFDQNIATDLISQGGAVYAQITAEVNDVRFTSNSANEGGAISAQFVMGDAVWFESNEAVSNGGALHVTNYRLQLSNMMFYQNTAGQSGGAIYQTNVILGEVDPYIVNSAFHLNNATGDGGALWTDTPRGLDLANVTISSNTAAGNGGGIFLATSGILTATNVTLNMNFTAGLGTAIFKEGEMWLQNTIIGPHNAGACVKIATPFISLGNNLSAAADCDLTQPSDQVNTDPLLDNTQDNGGLTWTAALLPDSPAINAADDAACAAPFVNGLDQRGRPRTSSCDIGAFELVEVVYLPLIIR